MPGTLYHPHQLQAASTLIRPYRNARAEEFLQDYSDIQQINRRH